MEKKRYTIRLHKNLEKYVKSLAEARGLSETEVIKNIIADQKQRDECNKLEVTSEVD